MEVLLDLARDAKLEVRSIHPRADEIPSSSAVCRVRDAFWVILSSADPVAIQLQVLATALREHASDLIEDRYLPPAVRALLEDG